MTLEKPWSKEFDELLRKLESSWGGKIKRPGGKRAEQDPRFAASDFFFYPTYYGEIEDFKISVNIGEIGGGDLPMLAGADNVEFLNIRVYVNNDYRIKMSHEGKVDKFKKLFGLSEDTPTGNKRLDKKYVLKTASDRDKSLLKSMEFQEHIQNLEPFSHFEISKAQIIWLQGLSDKSQLDFSNIEKNAKTLIEIAKIIG
ncbi:MAG: hypothetical protein GF310_05730 [candidate division Zixibacteria bacterium]|nr:hypothetical protein [candidate division Zixibacteria bacterium]